MARILIVLIIIGTQKAVASSCCGQAPTSFPVLNLRQALSLSTSFVVTDSMGRVFSDPKAFYLFESKKRTQQTLALSAASQVTDFSQVFINFGLSRGEFDSPQTSQSSQHIGDSLIGYNYEILPEFSFSHWKPNVHITALVNLPTGRSIYDQDSLSEGAGVTGHNQWGAGIGLTLKKVYYPLTLTLQTKVIELFKKQINGNSVSGFYDQSASLLASYGFKTLVSNIGLSYSRLSERTVNGKESESSNSTTVLLSAQKPLSDKLLVGVSYSDQTWLGSAKNTLLNRSIGISLNYNYY